MITKLNPFAKVAQLSDASLGGSHIDNARGARSSGNNFNLTLATENAPPRSRAGE